MTLPKFSPTLLIVAFWALQTPAWAAAQTSPAATPNPAPPAASAPGPAMAPAAPEVLAPVPAAGPAAPTTASEAAPAPQASSLSVAPPPAAVPTPEPEHLKVHELSHRLVELEQKQIALETQRKEVKVWGPRIGTIAALSVAGILAYGALVAFGNAESIKRELDKDDCVPDADTYDKDNDGDVDKSDEAHARRVARGLILSSLAPLAAGVVSGVFLAIRKRQRARLTREINAITPTRRAILKDLDTQLNVSGTQAGIDLRLRF
ncbi:MAG: hypothetical protein QM778_24595 [Myxococcales bacterium]